ncbi:hypothetical protein ACC755_09845 [Rhizobium ruizarguesonis]|uniref:hypothetical protein n=1 Tax=Rhizobium ruizarguesonis TaxID=2081791 RepID=UPI00102FFF6E|nr:hypothetical protein [Rhizobium ruizarguesonis]TAY84532.1 hypothetical protein ELH85_32435 [Rhizobium ruizarguesonis]
MSGNLVADIVLNQVDSTGSEIKTIYSKVSTVYAVYRNNERVMVQFSDDPKLGSEQRLALAHLSPLRGEITALIDGWRKDDSAQAKRYDRRTADALTVALQGDQVHAEELLKAVKLDIIEERTSIGRIYYMAFAVVCAIAVFLFFAIISSQSFVKQNNVWLAAGFGSLGALFSIAIGIRSREIHTDLRKKDNVLDATLRILIGAVSAFILFSLLKSHLVSIIINRSEVILDNGSQPRGNFSTHLAIVLAFLAGFSERLVGNFLGTVTLAGIGSQSAGPGATPSMVSAREHKEANEQKPMGVPQSPVPSSGEDAVDGQHDHAVDNCLCGIALAPEEETDDVNLPKSTGGVEKAA